MTCPYTTFKFLEYNTCGLGLYGGKPSHATCERCIRLGENTPEFAKELQERLKSSHPVTARKVSGCCDSAKNYT
jgi:hypothetical protein